MPLKLFRRSARGPWYVRGSIRGISVYESTGLDRKADAEEILALRTAALLRESVYGRTAVRTFAHAALSYLKKGGDGMHLQPLLDYFGETKLQTIGQDEVDVAARELKPNGSPSTRNRSVYTPVIAVLTHAARSHWCDKPMIQRPKLPPGRVRWITPAEAERLIDAAAPHLAPLVIFLLSSGARLSEALYLDWSAVDLERAHVMFLNVEAGGRGTKNGESRGVPLHPRAVAALKGLPHRDGAVFRRSLPFLNKAGELSPLGQAYQDREGRGGGQVKTAWSAMLRRAHIRDFTPHDARHTWATWHYSANRDLAALMQLGGWKSVEMVMRYAHTDTSHLAPSINRLWAPSGAKSVHPQTARRKRLASRKA